MGRYLVVTADDFGYCTERNRGIVAGYLAGGITRTSLLVTAAAAKQAAHLAALHSIPLGLHFNVTEGVPVSDRGRVVSLLTETGVFKGKNGFREAVSTGHVNLEEVRVELAAQLALFRDLTGQQPLYVDGHNHTHLLPGVSSVFAGELRAAGVRSSRIPCEEALQSAAGWLLPAARMAFYQDVVREAAAAATVFSQHGIRFSAGFVGMATMGADMTLGRLERLLHETYQQLAIKGTRLTGEPPRVPNGDTNCDRLTEGVPRPTDQPPCDEDKDGRLLNNNPWSGTGRRGETGTRTVETNSQRSETQTLDSEGHHIWQGSAQDTLHHCVNSSPCDKDKIGEREGMPIPHDDNNNKSTDNGADTGDVEHPLVGDTGTGSEEEVVVELMVHPGYPCVDPRGGCGVGPDDFSRSADRSHELDILCSKEWRSLCEAHQLTLCAQLPTARARC